MRAKTGLKSAGGHHDNLESASKRHWPSFTLIAGITTWRLHRCMWSRTSLADLTVSGRASQQGTSAMPSDSATLLAAPIQVTPVTVCAARIAPCRSMVGGSVSKRASVTTILRATLALRRQEYPNQRSIRTKLGMKSEKTVNPKLQHWLLGLGFRVWGVGVNPKPQTLKPLNSKPSLNPKPKCSLHIKNYPYIYKIPGPEHNYNNPTIIISPKPVIFVGTRISIKFRLTLIGFLTYISGIIITGVSRDGDRSFKGGGRGGPPFINTN